MLKIIKNVPKKIAVEVYDGPHRQQAYKACWEPSLNNPFLNKLYKNSVCYTERWYLELRQLIHAEKWQHPLVNVAVHDTNLKIRLIKSAVIDGTLMRSILDSDEHPAYQMSAGVNLRKINRWCGFFTSLPDSIEILADLNGQSRD